MYKLFSVLIYCLVNVMFVVTSACVRIADVSQIVVSIIGGMQMEPGLCAVARAYEIRHPDVQVSIELKGGGYGLGYPT